MAAKVLFLAVVLLSLETCQTCHYQDNYRSDNRCGDSYLAPNGEVAQCNPDGEYPCCSPYNWCGNTADHCDCDECVDYRTNYRRDNRCGDSYLAPNGEVAQCNPEGEYPCCSPYNWCGNTADHCDCDECVDYRTNYRSDNRCGDSYLAPNGEVAQCNPEGEYPCCSPYNWCGNTADHCDCDECVDYRTNYRSDNRCGDSYLAPNGEVAQCNPEGEYPCCSPYNWCGNTADHCDCDECVDYRTNYRSDNRCGDSYLAPNGEVAQCNPEGEYPCCSPYNWCGNTADHCDCDECVDYRTNYRSDNRCGDSYLAPNGEVAQCNPEGEYPCCSPYNWCGNTADHCDCDECVDYRTNYRSDNRCGDSYLAPNGEVAQCNPEGEYPCCSPYNWCGNTADHCDCDECVDYRTNYRSDNRCGDSYLAPNGEVAQCNPEGEYPCCSPYNWCGNTADHCDCDECVDYRITGNANYREDNRCGGSYPAPNGEVAKCNPVGEYPCCSPYNWCGNTADHCDCDGCVDYRITCQKFRSDARCGGSYLAPNGEVAQCNPEGEYPCCSPYNWCGITSDHCGCAECVDYRSSGSEYRDDHRCGGNYLAPNGKPAKCNPNGIYPCCSPWNWCGNTADHCDCEKCVDFRNSCQALRSDYQCGAGFPAPNGEPAKCDAFGVYPCCSPYNWCGITPNHCDCEDCVDYRI